MHDVIINDTMKMADVIDRDQRALILMPRFGLQFGFGDKSIKQVCSEHNLDTGFFLMMLNSFLYPHYFPGKKLKDVDVNLLLYYLAATHDYYMQQHIPALQEMFERFLMHDRSPAKLQLSRFFSDYIREVTDHIEYEEKVVFPYITELLKGNSAGLRTESTAYTISQFEEKHDNIEEKLSDLRSLLIKYYPCNDQPFLRIRILSSLHELEQDLINHARLEDKILIPLVEKLEKKLMPG